MTLGEFVNFLILLLHKQKINLALHKQSAWHNLFYKLKKMPETAGKPDFLKELRFDWDLSYPELPELSEHLIVLCMNGCVLYDSPCFQNFWLEEKLADLWSERFEKLDKDTKGFLQTAFEFAVKELNRETR